MRNNEYAFGFIAGIGVGVGVAILLAPKSGEDTRSIIADKTREGMAYLKEQGRDLRDSASNLIDNTLDQVTSHAHALKAAVETGRHAYRAPAD